VQIGEEDEIDRGNLQFESDGEDDHNESDGNGTNSNGTNSNNSPSGDSWSSPLFTTQDLTADDSLLDEETFEENLRKVAVTSTRRVLLPPPLTEPLPLHHQRATNLAKVQQRYRKRQQKQAAEEDDHRPDSDKTALQPLQLAKERQRALNRNHQQGKIMSTGTRSKKRNSDDADLNDNGDENLSQMDDTSAHVPRKKGGSSRDRNDSPSMVSQGSGDVDDDDVMPPLAPNAVAMDRLAGVAKDAAGKARAVAFKAHVLKEFMELSKKTPEELEVELAKQRKKDAKLGVEKRLPLIDRLRKNLAIAKWKRAQDNVTMLSMQERLEELESGKGNGNNVKMLKMQERIKELELEKTKRMSRSQAQKMRVCAEIQTKVEQVTKSILWRTTKFMTCPEDLANAVDKVIVAGGFCDGMSATMRDSFAVTYAQIVKKALNSQRNYLTQELKKIAFKVFLDKGLELPKPDVILSCAIRQVPDANKPKFKLYWTQVLRTLVDAKIWSKDVFYYTTPLAARMDPNDAKSKKLFAVSHEAMLCVVWDNNWKKWQDQYAFAQNPDNKGKSQPNLPGKWTRSDTGQAEWGGWSTDGLKAFNHYKKTIREGREGRMDEIRAYESKILGELRRDVGIEADSHEAQLRLNRAKKRRTNAEKPVAEVQVHLAIATVDEEDEEED
jgi:hypothetical protein